MERDLTKESDVVAYMKTAYSESDWNKKCDEVKSANDGYPSFWYRAIVLSGIASQVSCLWSRRN